MSATRPIYINGRFMVQTLSGVQRFAREITRALAERWPETGLASPAILAPAGGEAIAGGAHEGWPLRRIGRFGGHRWEQVELPRAVGRGLLVNLGNTAPLLPALLGRRQIVVIHDAGVFSTPHSYSRAFRTYYKGLHRLLALGRTRIVTVSAFAQRDIARHLRIDPASIAVIPEGCDHALRVMPDTRVLDQHGLRAGGFVLAVGNNAPHKDFGALADLAATLSRQGRKLVISGGVDRRVFENTGAALADATYVGRITDEELGALYRHAGCFVFPSIYEGFGLPPVEAMACSCPVVARDIPVLREICGPGALYGVTGPDLTTQVMAVLNDPERAEMLRTAGQQQAARYRWSHAADALLDVIRQELQA